MVQMELQGPASGEQHTEHAPPLTDTHCEVTPLQEHMLRGEEHHSAMRRGNDAGGRLGRAHPARQLQGWRLAA